MRTQGYIYIRTYKCVSSIFMDISRVIDESLFLLFRLSRAIRFLNQHPTLIYTG
ncbi:hypothetical protein WN51_06838 [Melipona quadrifasciata]|uniref:Uncharacterized protein n=1 Tax=Melipona quadrifasciata TaxID=166423 RepID=A0A0N0BCF4_9HYME|nr:hypothetical protein WN51_06838 [Melipona quadrifasciata]